MRVDRECLPLWSHAQGCMRSTEDKGSTSFAHLAVGHRARPAVLCAVSGRGVQGDNVLPKGELQVMEATKARVSACADEGQLIVPIHGCI